MTGLTRVILALTVVALVATTSIHLIERASALVIEEMIRSLPDGH